MLCEQYYLAAPELKIEEFHGKLSFFFVYLPTFVFNTSLKVHAKQQPTGPHLYLVSCSGQARSCTEL